MSSDEAQVIIIGEPGINDVMLGRGAGTNRHPGNINFRNICKEYQKEYVKAINNYEKYLITMDIMERIQKLDPPGRFIDKDSKKKTWYDVGEYRARRKISQALRENAPDIKKKQKHDCDEVSTKLTQKEKDLVEDKMKRLRVEIDRPQVMTVEKPKMTIKPHEQFYNDANASIDIDQSIAMTKHNINMESMDIKKSLNLSDIFEESSLPSTCDHPSMLDMDTSVGTFAIDKVDMNFSINLNNLKKAINLDDSIALDNLNKKKTMDLSSSMLDIENSLGTFALDDRHASSNNIEKKTLDDSIALDNVSKRRSMELSATMIDIENSIGTFGIEDVSANMSLSKSTGTIVSSLTGNSSGNGTKKI